MPVGTPFKKGNKAAAARGPNKITRTVKETVLAVFNEIQSDPKVKLSQFAKNHPKEFYLIASKLIPTEISGAIDHQINLNIVRGKSNIKRLTSGTTESTTGSEEV
jgi:hypothetical protein